MVRYVCFFVLFGVVVIACAAAAAAAGGSFYSLTLIEYSRFTTSSAKDLAFYLNPVVVVVDVIASYHHCYTRGVCVYVCKCICL